MHNNLYIRFHSMKPEDTLDFHIRWAWLKISKMYNHEAAQVGLTQSAGYILLNIDPKNVTPSTQLGPMMGMEPTSLSRSLKNLEERGWITRKKDVRDGRIQRIVLTEEGSRLRNISKATVVKFNQKVLDEITPEKFEHFKEVIQIIDKYTVKQL
jgi:DNA-binding MarR family transcriptional regulator